MNKKFYTYIYLDPRWPGKYVYGNYQFDYRPFYVGKGQGYQHRSHLYEAIGPKPSRECNNPYKTNKIKKIQRAGLKPKIIKVEKNLLEQEAFDLEIWLIWAIGRLDLKTGLLTNLTDGGEGPSGIIFTEEMKKKMGWSRGKTKENHPGIARQAEKMKGKNNPFYGNHHTKKIREKMSVAKKGRTKENDPGVARMAEKKRGRTKENDSGVARQAEKMRGDNNPMKRPEVAKKVKENWKKRKQEKKCLTIHNSIITTNVKWSC